MNASSSALLQALPFFFEAVALDLGEHARGLLAAHDRDARVRPHPQETRAVRTAAHAVVAGAETAADDDGEFRYAGARHRRYQLGAVLGDAPRFVFFADHETSDVLQEDQRDAALCAQFDEMRAFQRGLRIQDAVVGDDADRVAVNMCKAAYQRRAIKRLELVEFAAIDDTRDDFAHVERLARVGGNDAMQLRCVIQGFARFAQFDADFFFSIQVGNDPAGKVQGMGIVVRIVIGHTRHPRMDVGATQFFRADDLAGGGFHQRRAGQENRALVPDDDRFVSHGGHIGSAGGARSHHAGDLRDAQRRHVRLVVENAAEVVAIGKDLVPGRQIGAAGIDQVNARQVILLRNLLRAQMLFYRHRKICPALDRRVIGNHHALAPRHAPHSGHDAGRGHLVVVHVPGRELRQFQERRADVEQATHAFAWQQLAATDMLFPGRFAPAFADEADFLTQIGYQD